MSCYVILCYIILYYTMLHYSIVYYTLFCYVILYHIMQCFAMLYCCRLADLTHLLHFHGFHVVRPDGFELKNDRTPKATPQLHIT